MTINDIEAVDIFAVINGEGHRLLLSKAQNNAIFEYLKIITQDDKVLSVTKEVYYNVKNREED